MKKYFIGYIIVLLLPVLAIELASLSYLSISNKNVKTPSEYISKFSRYEQKKSCSWSDYVSHHPYLMIRYKRTGKCINNDVNQRGMIGEDFGHTKDQRYYNILLLGGSVAEQLHQTGLLEEKLNKNYQLIDGRPFKVWSAAISAGQQPRQSIANLMYGDIADIVVTLEGFNEQFNLTAHFPIDTPALSWYELEEIILNSRNDDESSIQLRWILGILSNEIRSGNLFKNTYSGVAIVQLYEKIKARQISNFLAELSYNEQDSKDDRRKRYLKKYKSYVSAMSAVAKSREQALFVFFQPVPLIGKNLTQQEIEINKDMTYANRYLETIREISTLKDDRLYIKDLTQIFKDFKGELYEDIIHFSSESNGDSILSAQMTNFIAEKLEIKKKK